MKKIDYTEKSSRGERLGSDEVRGSERERTKDRMEEKKARRHRVRERHHSAPIWCLPWDNSMWNRCTKYFRWSWVNNEHLCRKECVITVDFKDLWTYVVQMYGTNFIHHNFFFQFYKHSSSLIKNFKQLLIQTEIQRPWSMSSLLAVPDWSPCPRHYPIH